MNSNYEAVIGLEVHAQLKTKTKIFCNCSAEFSSDPNVNVCPVCLGHPGSLPVLNKQVVEYAVKMGLACKSEINLNSILARKSYFYPDLPKGYQISQFDDPICIGGFVKVKDELNNDKDIKLTRIHIEEDAGKLIHDQGNTSLVDVNRCGVPLIEIVSEPDLRSAKEAANYLAKIRQLVRYLNICDGNMEEGSLRCDANISVRVKGVEEFGTKTEIKNMNSIKNVEKAINYEIERQLDIIEDGGRIIQETLLWDADKGEAISMRSKEEANDYRYFPDPDLLPVTLSKSYVDTIINLLPELPDVKLSKYISQYKLPEYDAGVLTQDIDIANYFESIIQHNDDYKSAANWVMGDVLKVLNEQKIKINNFKISGESLSSLIDLINNGTISSKIAKDVFIIMLQEQKSPLEIIKEKNLMQLSDPDKIGEVIENILNDHPSEVQQYIEGKDKVVGFFTGKIMKETAGKANPKIVNEVLKEKLEKLKNKV